MSNFFIDKSINIINKTTKQKFFYNLKTKNLSLKNNKFEKNTEVLLSIKNSLSKISIFLLIWKLKQNNLQFLQSAKLQN